MVFGIFDNGFKQLYACLDIYARIFTMVILTNMPKVDNEQIIQQYSTKEIVLVLITASLVL